MKTLKISLSLLIPTITGIAVFTGLYFVTGSYLGHIHDVYASNTRAGLMPIMSVISFVIGFAPMAFYMADLFFSPIQLSEVEIEQASEVLTATLPSIHVGQVFTSIGANCQVRVKALKNIFADLREDQYKYILQTSLF